MFDFFTEVRVLQEEGKLHKKLITRTRMLFIVSFVLVAIVAFNIVFRDVGPFISLALAAVGFVLGFYVFSRMTVVNWNEEEHVVQAGKMDVLGYASIALYIVFEVSFRTYLHDFYPLLATSYLFAGIAGTILGRAVGMVVEIHKVFQATHAKKF